MMYWVKKKGDENELISSTIDTSIRELSFHGRIVFQEWIEKIKKEVKVCYPNVVPRTLDYDIALDIAINSDVAW
jgi:phenolic acid decarboxylase